MRKIAIGCGGGWEGRSFLEKFLVFICRVDSWICFMSFAGLYCLCDSHHIDFGVYVFLCVSHVFNRNGVYVLGYMEFVYMEFMYWVTVKRLCL